MRAEFFGLDCKDLARTLAEIYTDIIPHLIEKPKDYKKKMKIMRKLIKNVEEKPKKYIKEGYLEE